MQMLMDQVNKLQEVIRNLQETNANNIANSRVESSPPMMVTNPPVNDNPPDNRKNYNKEWKTRNSDYMREYYRLDNQRKKINKQLKSLKSKYGIR